MLWQTWPKNCEHSSGFLRVASDVIFASGTSHFNENLSFQRHKFSRLATVECVGHNSIHCMYVDKKLTKNNNRNYVITTDFGQEIYNPTQLDVIQLTRWALSWFWDVKILKVHFSRKLESIVSDSATFCLFCKKGRNLCANLIKFDANTYFD